MPHWSDKPTKAHSSVATALRVVDNLLRYVKETKGKPSTEERALFAAGVVFTYGIWENFVEQLAIELAERVSKAILPETVPEQIRKTLEKRSAWELTVSPGWRTLWLEQVKVQAVGDDDERFGMNTAKAGQVKALLVLTGASDPFAKVPANVIPSHLPENLRTVTDAVNTFVELRGEIVHTGKVPNSLRKAHVLAWRKFVDAAAKAMDEACREQCRKLVP